MTTPAKNINLAELHAEIREFFENNLPDGEAKEDALYFLDSAFEGAREAMVQFAVWLSQYDAIIWMCQNQRGKRNATEEQLRYLMGKEYDATKNKWGGDRKSKPEKQVLKPNGPTSYIVAEKYGVGHDAVEKNAQFAKSVDAIAQTSTEAKQKILSGEVMCSQRAIAAPTMRFALFSITLI